MSDAQNPADSTAAQSAGGAAVAITRPKPSAGKKPAHLPPYHVILLNDDDHSHEYVIEMLKALFGHSNELGYKMAVEVDKQGRVIVYTTHKEKAELKREQIHSFGADGRVATSAGSMSAVIEPAEG